MCKPITVGTLLEINAHVSGMMFEAPFALLIPSFFIIPSISEGIRGSLGLRVFFRGYLPWDIMDDRQGDMVVGVYYG